MGEGWGGMSMKGGDEDWVKSLWHRFVLNLEFCWGKGLSSEHTSGRRGTWTGAGVPRLAVHRELGLLGDADSRL